MIVKYSNYIKENKTVDSYFLQTYEETKAWLDSMYIRKYTINDDLTVDVNMYVNISNDNLTKLPVQFGVVDGDFACYHNKLISLKGTPTVVDNFYCDNNPLKNINDLDSKILIKSIKYCEWTEEISTELYDDYFEHWISKDINIVSALKDKVSDTIKEKYKHLFNANSFDLI